MSIIRIERDAIIAQWLERLPCKQEVPSSILGGGFIKVSLSFSFT